MVNDFSFRFHLLYLHTRDDTVIIGQPVYIPVPRDYFYQDIYDICQLFAFFIILLIKRLRLLRIPRYTSLGNAERDYRSRKSKN